jgi:hypothetical protein
MTDTAARQKLAALDRRWCAIGSLTLTGVVGDGDGWRHATDLLRELSRHALAIDRLRITHPALLRPLEARFRKALKYSCLRFSI